MQRAIASLVARVHIGSGIDQQFCRCFTAHEGGNHQRRPAGFIDFIQIDSGFDEQLNGSRIIGIQRAEKTARGILDMLFFKALPDLLV
jgi:hypothetical protein